MAIAVAIEMITQTKLDQSLLTEFTWVQHNEVNFERKIAAKLTISMGTNLVQFSYTVNTSDTIITSFEVFLLRSMCEIERKSKN